MRIEDLIKSGKVRFIRDYVAIKREPREDKIGKNLFYINTNSYRTYAGEILGVGNTLKKKLKRGDKIYFGLYSTVLELDDDIVVIKEIDVLGFQRDA